MELTYIIIAHNEESTIAYAIQSIKLQNKIKQYEIIVIDDGSTDKTAEVVKTLQKTNKFIRLNSLSENKGRGYSRQKGIESAKGNFIAFVDSDIILPAEWTERCLRALHRYDVVGGIAVPDGDVNYLFRKFNLTPKKAPHTAEITGSNCMAKKEVFVQLGFSNMPDGEDVDFSWRATKKNISVYSIPDLVVTHKESKNFFQSLLWLFQSGIGSTRLFIKFKKVRKPDVALSIFLALVLVSIASPVLTPLLLIYVVSVSFLHLSSKFDRADIVVFACAVLVNTILLVAFFVGRFVGFAELVSFSNKS